MLTVGSFTQSLSLSVCLSVSPSLSVSPFNPQSRLRWHFTLSVSVCLYVCLSLSLSVSLCLSLCLCLSLSRSLFPRFRIYHALCRSSVHLSQCLFVSVSLSISLSVFQCLLVLSLSVWLPVYGTPPPPPSPLSCYFWESRLQERKRKTIIKILLKVNITELSLVGFEMCYWTEWNFVMAEPVGLVLISTCIDRGNCLSVCLSLRLSVCLSACLSVCLSLRLSVCLSVRLSVSLPLSLSLFVIFESIDPETQQMTIPFS